jgi:hypothetical protein
MNYNVIFTSGFTDDIESLERQVKCDILILDENGNYYNPQFITFERIKSEFDASKNCYLEDNLVILHKITKTTILNSIPELHKWMFYKRWIPLDINQLETYFYPQSDWIYIKVEIV